MSTDVYAQKLQEAEQIVNAHYDQLPSGSAKVVWKDIIAKIQAFGGTTQESLRELTWEDLEQCGLPRLLARRIANQVFRAVPKETTAKPLTANRILALSFPELFANYDINGEHNPAVADRLRTESGGKRCVVLNQDGSVNVEASSKVLRQLKDGLPEVDTITIKDQCLRVVKVGDRPNLYFDQNPLFPHEVLRDNVCDKIGRSYENIALAVRQVLFLALTKTKELTIGCADDAHSVLDAVEARADQLSFVKNRYRRAGLLFDDLQSTGELPTLRRTQKSFNGGNGGKNDPFGQHIRT